MRTFFLGVLLFAQVGFGAPQTEVVEISKVYAPNGYDTNDPTVEITLAGTFPTACYYKASAEFDKRGHQIFIRQLAYKYEGTKEFCGSTKVAYTNTIGLGSLEKEQTYEVINADTGAILTTLEIVQAPAPLENPDSVPYAAVQQVSIWKNTASKKNELRLVIPMRNACDRMKMPVDIDIQKNRSTLLVRPIVESVGPSKACPDAPFRYVHTEELPDTVKGDWLLHVRALGGQSFNQVTTLE